MRSCSYECSGSAQGPLCGTDVVVSSDCFAGCFTFHCCDAFAVCTDDGSDVDGCVACLLGETEDPTRCLAADACAVDHCGDRIAPHLASR